MRAEGEGKMSLPNIGGDGNETRQQHLSEPGPFKPAAIEVQE